MEPDETGEGTQLVRSVLQENVVVGKDCIIEEVLARHTVGDGAVLRPGCYHPDARSAAAPIDSGVWIEGNVDKIRRRVRGARG